jgi:hypothetical protein
VESDYLKPCRGPAAAELGDLSCCGAAPAELAAAGPVVLPLFERLLRGQEELAVVPMEQGWASRYSFKAWAKDVASTELEILGAHCS